MSQPEDQVCVGAIAGSYGVKGDVRIKSFCATPEDIADYGVLTSEQGKTYTLTLGHAIKNGFAATLAEVHTKEEADALKGVRLLVARSQLPSLPDDEYYYSDLEGLAVFDTGGTHLGRVKLVQNHGATDILEVQTPGSSDTALVPFTREIVPTVDLASGRIVVDPPEGIF